MTRPAFIDLQNNHILFSLLLMLCVFSVHAQTPPAMQYSRSGIGAGFDNFDFGNNVNATFRYERRKPYLLYAGLSYFIPSKNSSHVEILNGFYGFNAKQYYAADAVQRLGFKLGVERYIRHPNETRFELFWFYDIQYNVLSRIVLSINGYLGNIPGPFSSITFLPVNSSRLCSTHRHLPYHIQSARSAWNTLYRKIPAKPVPHTGKHAPYVYIACPCRILVE